MVTHKEPIHNSENAVQYSATRCTLPPGRKAGRHMTSRSICAVPAELDRVTQALMKDEEVLDAAVADLNSGIVAFVVLARRKGNKGQGSNLKVRNASISCPSSEAQKCSRYLIHEADTTTVADPKLRDIRYILVLAPKA